MMESTLKELKLMVLRTLCNDLRSVKLRFFNSNNQDDLDEMIKGSIESMIEDITFYIRRNET